MRRPERWERQEHWQGQRLQSQDFNDRLIREAHLRWWHNRALHAAYGIAVGLETRIIEVNGRPTALCVSPGLAYDCYGRELVLTTETKLPLPSGDVPRGGLVLLIMYREDATDRAACASAGMAAPHPDVDLVWQRARGLSPGEGVPLARINARGVLQEEYSAPRARRYARPRIGSGATIRRETAWRTWNLPAPTGHSSGLLGLQVTVDTAAAGFTGVPCYFAWMPHGLWDPAVIGAIGWSAEAEIEESRLDLFQMVAFTVGHVAESTATQFTYRLWMPHVNRNLGPSTESALLNHARHYPVHWLGIEHEPGDRSGGIRMSEVRRATADECT
jgi:hypothetical protein